MMILLFALLFPPIVDTIPDGPFSYPGKYQLREEITVDPSNSPLLANGYQQLQNQLSFHYTEKEILQIALLYVRETLFDISLCNESQVKTLLQNRQTASLDLFLQEKIGVCRHIALTTTYLIEKLIRDGWLKGQAFFIREDIPGMRHAWTLFLSEEGAWHLDPYWAVLENGKTFSGFSQLCQKYSSQTMDRQKVRWE